MKILSLFSGAGGLDLGLIQAGNTVIWANDIDKNAVETYRRNIGDHIVLDDIKNIDTSIVKVMYYGFKFSFILCIISTYILFLYVLNPFSHILFDVGYLIFKCSLMFFVSFFTGALATDKIKKIYF